MIDCQAVIFGLEGYRLTDSERGFFREINPLGYILFKRNVKNPDQLRRLTDSLRTLSGRSDCPILIDQEGGRVQRLGPPHWRQAVPAAKFGEIWDRNRKAARRALDLNCRLIAHDLITCGINVNCAPVLDVPLPEVTKAIGARAFHPQARVIAKLARIAAQAYLDQAVLPVIKHIPGHGRAICDSHLALPHVDSSPDILEKSDFIPFAELADYPIAMTAHILFTAYDAHNPATLSDIIIKQIIRDRLGFDGLLLTDDLSMKALSGSFDARARKSLAAGCDIILHCNGDRAEMDQVARGLSKMTPDAQRRWFRAADYVPAASPFDPLNAQRELDLILK